MELIIFLRLYAKIKWFYVFSNTTDFQRLKKISIVFYKVVSVLE